MITCSKCGKSADKKNLLTIETDSNIYYYCIICITEAEDLLSMAINLNKETKALLKIMRKYLKDEKKHSN